MIKSEHEDIYNDVLRDLFERQTGLYTSLSGRKPMVRIQHEKKVAGTYRPQQLPTNKGAESDAAALGFVIGKGLKFLVLGVAKLVKGKNK